MYNELYDKMKQVNEANETAHQQLERMKAEFLDILKKDKRAYVGLGLDFDNLGWQAVASSEAESVEEGKWYYNNYGMHYSGGYASEGYETPEALVEEVFAAKTEDLTDADLEKDRYDWDSKAQPATDNDVLDQPCFEHDAEEILPTIIKGWKPEDDNV